jgi:hypothetical protein
MAEKFEAKKSHQMPFVVRQAGLPTYGPYLGAIVGFNDKKAADIDATERNTKAETMHSNARYEVVPGNPDLE